MIIGAKTEVAVRYTRRANTKKTYPHFAVILTEKFLDKQHISLRLVSV